MLLRLAPVLFVLIWSTGWITAKAAAPLADPLTFLVLRYGAATLALALLILIARVPIPRDPRAILHAMASGVLLHAIYLGGVWYAIDKGLPTPLSGLIAAIQPLLTAVLAVLWLCEKLNPRQWLGLALGFIGLVVAFLPKLASLDSAALAGIGWLIGVNIVAMVAVTFGSLYQKRYLAGGDLRVIALLQYVGATLATLPVAYLVEDMQVTFSLETMLVLAWSVLGLSLAAIGLYLMLIRHGAVSRAATLIYLIPPTVALEAYFLFGEGLGPIQIAAMGLTVFGVYLVNARKAA